MESNFKVPFIKYDPEIKNYASKFLHEHNPSLKIPVPIEEIAEFDLGIDIIPIPGLMDVLNIDGFISSNLKELEVDEYIYSNRPTRYRFTLAHEIGHIVMHVGILKAGKIKKIDDYMRFMQEIPEVEYKKLEFQANAFSGLVLVPCETLSADVAQQFTLIRKKWPELVKESKVMWDTLGNVLSKKYAVSASVIERRIEYDKIKQNYTCYFTEN